MKRVTVYQLADLNQPTHGPFEMEDAAADQYIIDGKRPGVFGAEGSYKIVVENNVDAEVAQKAAKKKAKDDLTSRLKNLDLNKINTVAEVKSVLKDILDHLQVG